MRGRQESSTRPYSSPQAMVSQQALQSNVQRRPRSSFLILGPPQAFCTIKCNHPKSVKSQRHFIKVISYRSSLKGCMLQMWPRKQATGQAGTSGKGHGFTVVAAAFNEAFLEIVSPLLCCCSRIQPLAMQHPLLACTSGLLLAHLPLEHGSLE